jgi:hypothetical protein
MYSYSARLISFEMNLKTTDFKRNSSCCNNIFYTSVTKLTNDNETVNIIPWLWPPYTFHCFFWQFKRGIWTPSSAFDIFVYLKHMFNKSYLKYLTCAQQKLFKILQKKELGIGQCSWITIFLKQSICVWQQGAK